MCLRSVKLPILSDKRNKKNTSTSTTVLWLPERGTINSKDNTYLQTKGREKKKTRGEVNSDIWKSNFTTGRTRYGPVDYSGTLYVKGKDGSDYIGVVFGYQSNRKFYVAMWRRENLNFANSNINAGIKGLQLKVTNTVLLLFAVVCSCFCFLVISCCCLLLYAASFAVPLLFSGHSLLSFFLVTVNHELFTDCINCYRSL